MVLFICQLGRTWLIVLNKIYHFAVVAAATVEVML